MRPDRMPIALLLGVAGIVLVVGLAANAPAVLATPETAHTDRPAREVSTTNVSGVITQNTTWTLAGSPYVLNNVEVTGGVTLTVQPGVSVVGGGQLTVRGHLQAVGTPAQRSIKNVHNAGAPQISSHGFGLAP